MQLVQLFCFLMSVYFNKNSFFLSVTRIGGDDEDELLGNAADAETRGQKHGSDDDDDDDNDDDIDVEDIDVGSDDGNDDGDWFGGDVDDDDDNDKDDDESTKIGGRGRKRKHGGTPFVSLEDYENMVKDYAAENGKRKKLRAKEINRNKSKGAKNDKNKKRKKSN